MTAAVRIIGNCLYYSALTFLALNTLGSLVTGQWWAAIGSAASAYVFAGWFADDENDDEDDVPVAEDAE